MRENGDNGYEDVYKWQLHNVVREFYDKYPGIEGVNGMVMRAVLKGDKILVRVPNAPGKVTICTKDEILSGKLDSLYASLKRANGKVRKLTEENKNAFMDAFGCIRGVVDTKELTASIEKIILMQAGAE